MSLLVGVFAAVRSTTIVLRRANRLGSSRAVGSPLRWKCPVHSVMDKSRHGNYDDASRFVCADYLDVWALKGISYAFWSNSTLDRRPGCVSDGLSVFGEIVCGRLEPAVSWSVRT